MKIRSQIYYFIIGVCLLSSCQEEDEEVDNSVTLLSTVITLPAEVGEEEGVTLNGEISIRGQVSGHGFIYSSDSSFSNNKNVVSLGRPQKSGLFQTNINTNLKSGVLYYYKTFIEIEEGLIYGKTKQFEFPNRRPIITRIIPEKGHLEDTVKIQGKFFGQNYQSTSVYFFLKRSRIVDISDTVITCVVPDDINIHQFSVTVTSEGKSAGFPYSLYSPIIDFFQPASATFRDTVEIIGQHFDIANARNTLLLGNTEAEIIFSARNRLQFVVPDDLAESSPNLQLTSQLQKVSSVEQFKLTAPMITTVTECSDSYQEILLEGSFLHPVPRKNKILMEGVEGEVVSGSTQQLTVRVPFGPFPRGKALIEVGIADTLFNTNLEVCIQDPWLMISNTLPFSYYGDVGTFSINERAFVIADSRDINDEDQYLWEFDPNTLTWTKHEIPFQLNHSGVCTSNGSKGYIYTATSVNNFWEFNPQNHEWKQKPDFPGERRDKAASFSLNEDVYFGLGSDFEPYHELDYFNFFKFDPDLNQWINISDFPNDVYSRGRTEASTFVINNIAYVTGGARSTGSYDSWKYIPGSDSWIRIADFPDARHYTSSFSLNGKGYIANGTPVGGGERRECWEYDPVADTWSAFFDIGHKNRFRGFSFVVNDTAYVGGGSGGRYNDLTEYELYKLTK